MCIPNLILFFNHHYVQFPCLWTDLNFSSSLTWKFDWDSKSDIVLSLKWLTGSQKSNFLFMDRLNIFFCLTLKFDGDSKSDIEVYLKLLSEPQKFVIMIRCKVNFDIIWYSVIFAANLYVWSSDILNFVFMNIVILDYLNFNLRF